MKSWLEYLRNYYSQEFAKNIQNSLRDTNPLLLFVRLGPCAYEPNSYQIMQYGLLKDLLQNNLLRLNSFTDFE